MKVFIEPDPPFRRHYEEFKCFECGETFWETKASSRGWDRHYCNQECKLINYHKIMSPVMKSCNMTQRFEPDPIARHLHRDYALTVEEFDDIPGLESINQ